MGIRMLRSIITEIGMGGNTTMTANCSGGWTVDGDGRGGDATAVLVALGDWVMVLII